MRNGKPSCHRQREEDPGHGPSFLLDCQTGVRKTTRSIPDARVAPTCAQVEECKRPRRLTSELIEVSKRLCDTRLAAASQAEIEALLSRGPEGALDLEATETAARRCALEVTALAVQDRLNADGSDWHGKAE